MNVTNKLERNDIIKMIIMADYVDEEEFLNGMFHCLAYTSCPNKDFNSFITDDCAGANCEICWSKAIDKYNEISFMRREM